MFMLYEKKSVIKAFKRLLLGIVMVGATAAQANIGYTLEGCRSGDIPSGYDLEANDFVCPDDAYTTGNLGKGWAELDLVPHRVTIENKGSEAESFTFTVGGDFLYALGGDLRGWDYISELILDVDLSNQTCIDWAVANQDSLVQQELLITPDGEGVGGVYTTIYRQISVNDPGAPKNGLPAGAKCVANYVQRLAIGSSGYTGSSLQSNLWNKDLESGGIGEKRIQLQDVKTALVEKDMVATQDEAHDWSIVKTGPTSVNFGDTCDANNPKEVPVDITVTWTKHPAAAVGEIAITSTITMTNASSRAIGVSISDQLYNDDGPLGDLQTCTDQIIPATSTAIVCQLTHTLDASLKDTGLYDIATASFSDPIYPDAVIEVTLDATANAVFKPGNTLYAEAVATDSESISSSNGMVTFASGAFDSETIGSYDAPYVAGEQTQDDVNWTSVTLTQSGSVTFHKTIAIDEAMIMEGALSDTAKITSDSLFMDNGSHDVNFTSTATVSLTIEKNMPDVLQEDESVDVNFTVAKGDFEQNVTITFTADETYDSVTLNGLEPGVYTVTENATPGFSPIGDVTKEVTINLPSCGNSVTFNNELAGQPKVIVQKITYPVEIDGVAQKGDWNMTLYKMTAPDTWEMVSSLMTDSIENQNVLVGEGALEEGTYKIVESMKDGWYQSGKTGECKFEVNYPEDLFRQDYSCTYTNTKYGKVIINKLTDPVGMTDKFFFTQNIDASFDLNLTDQGSKTFENVTPGQYQVTENDPEPEYGLIGLTCDERGVDNIVATTTTLEHRRSTINVDPGETVECTYTNQKRGMVEVLKYENGSLEYTTVWNFSLSGDNLNVADSTPPALMDFDQSKLIPGNIYTLCELNAQGTWINTWYKDGQEVEYYNPNYDPNLPINDQDNSTRCVDFSVESNQTVHFEVHNDYLTGGEPRTIGYWKNWTLCDGKGNQHLTAEKNGGFAEGYWLLDDVLAITLGETEFSECTDAVSILDKRDVKSGKKRAGDAAYGLASQLMAAKANYAAGAEQCQAASDAIAEGDALLTSLKFDGDGAYTRGKDAKDNAQVAHDIAGTLDDYNNDMLCP